MSSPIPFRYGILGTARIARAFVAGVRPSPDVMVAAVASRTLAQATAFGQELGIARAYGSYAELLQDPDLDAIYVALPNSLHAEWSTRALAAGKHVLCEKPLGLTTAEVTAMQAVAHRQQRHLMEAVPFRFQPQTLEMNNLLLAGAIGRVQMVRASIGFLLADPADIRQHPALGGGGLLDAGCYPVSLARLAIGEAPVWATASARWTPGGVDATVVGTLEYPSGALAQIACSLSTAAHRQAQIIGEQGLIETTYSNNFANGLVPALGLKRGTGWDVPTETVPVAAVNGFRAEAEALRALSLNLAPAGAFVTTRESWENAATLDALFASASSGNGQRVAVQQYGLRAELQS